MDKRAVNRSGAAIASHLSRSKRVRRAAEAACNSARESIERLESRTLLSSTIGPTATVEWNGRQVEAIPGQYVAVSNNFDAWARVSAQAGFTNIQNLGGQGYYQFDSTLSPDQITALSKAHPIAISSVEPNLVEHAADTFPNDPEAVNQWNLRNTGQDEPFYYNLDGFFAGSTVPPMDQLGTVGQDINAQKAWDISTGSSSVVVAVLDTGTDITHPDLIPNLWNNPDPSGQPGFANDVNGWNFVTDTSNVSDDNGHGTHVAGTIGAAGNNSIGVSGVDWHVSLLTVKVLDANGAGTDADIIAGINYITMLKNQGVNIVVINESLGGPGFPFDIVTSNALKSAGQAGILDVVAAGNDSANNDVTPTGPANLSLSNPYVITVAATDNQGKLAAFSNFGGSSVDIAAPGIDILSTTPTYPVTLTTESQLTPLLPQFTQNYGYLTGTSQATPAVAGIIALEAAVKPNATPLQLKKALLDGVTFDPNLASVNGLPPKVKTSGVANAYFALQALVNQFVTTDTTRAGNWAGFYGSTGAYVVGDSTTFPSFVNATFDGVSPVILDDSARSVVAPIKISDVTQRIEAYGATASSESINFAFTDGQIHRVGLYVADFDNKKRSEEIQIIDTVTGRGLDTQVVSGFKKGEYLFYDLSGSVQIRLTRLAGPSAVFSGIFFDPVPGDANVFSGLDTTTTGLKWRDNYGSQGEQVIGDTASTLPSYVTSLTAPTASTVILKAQTSAPQSLQRVLDMTHGIEAYWESSAPFDVTMDVSNSGFHQVTLYLADYDHKKRAERIEVVNPTTGLVLESQDFFNFTKGVFANFNIPGNAIFRVIPKGGPNAVVSGIFFDGSPGSQVRFTGTDNTTQGNWKAAGYGATFADVIGDSFFGANNHLTESGGTQDILHPLSDDPRALLKTENTIRSDRISSYLFTSTFMTLSLDFRDNLQHHIALYFVDFEKLHRNESITFTDPTTQVVLAQQRISNFQNGKYLLYDINGPVDITIVAGSLPNAVFSGLFSD